MDQKEKQLKALKSHKQLELSIKFEKAENNNQIE